MNPKISVVIPVYNGEQFITRTLDLVFRQTYPAHEIIVVDDGSTDRTPALLKDLGGRIIYKRIANAGPSVARNEGMKFVTGDWIAFLDADDFWFKNKLQKQAEVIQKYPSVQWTCCNYAVRYDYLDFRLTRHFSALRNRKEMDFDEPFKKNVFGLLIKENFVGTPSAVLLSRALMDKVGAFNPAYKNSQDYDLWLRCAVHSNAVATSEMLFFKKTHAKNLSGNKFNHYAAHKLILEQTLLSQKDYIRRHALEGVVHATVAETDYFYGDACFESGRWREAFRAYGQGLAASLTFSNYLKFPRTIAKKFFRILTFDQLNRQKIRALRNRLRRRVR